MCDDEEFYNEMTGASITRPFTPSEVVDIVTMLKPLIIRLYWTADDQALVNNDPTGLFPKEAMRSRDRSVTSLIAAPVTYLRDTLRSLLGQLYQRDSRRPFCPEKEGSSTSSSKSRKSTQSGSLWVCPDLDFTKLLSSPEQEKQSRARIMLLRIPWCCPFDTRVSIMASWVSYDRARHQVDEAKPVVHIRRGMLLEDAYMALGAAPVHLLKYNGVRIQFENSAGAREAGVDLGGLFKEFLTNVLDEGFNPNRSGLFVLTPSHQLYPSPKSDLVFRGNKEMLSFLGRCLGKAVYDGVVVDLPLATFFLSKLLGHRNTFDELASLDPEIYKNLVFVKHYEGDVDDLGLYFSVDDDTGTGKIITHDLIPRGRDIAVTSSNRIQYIYLMADYYLNKQIAEPCKAIVKGFHEVLPLEWVRLFSAFELGMLVTGRRADGKEEDIDLDDMEKHTKYADGYTSMSKTIRSFWKVVRELSPGERRKLVKFITGYPRAPLMGFGALKPPLCISCVENHHHHAPVAPPSAPSRENNNNNDNNNNDNDLRGFFANLMRRSPRSTISSSSSSLSLMPSVPLGSDDILFKLDCITEALNLADINATRTPQPPSARRFVMGVKAAK
eukprot:TRINITY_DN13708_c0_g1_i2.p1 TRINITY_DN13708_c0_g1~~TRINITY_DN13708_c0_g1_i2.p1  ORF type:complete len:671 (-),score=100.35 TRINITY_DN13708_c0_g1_i2:27-1859(-)